MMNGQKLDDFIKVYETEKQRAVANVEAITLVVELLKKYRDEQTAQDAE